MVISTYREICYSHVSGHNRPQGTALRRTQPIYRIHTQCQSADVIFVYLHKIRPGIIRSMYVHVRIPVTHQYTCKLRHVVLRLSTSAHRISVVPVFELYADFGRAHPSYIHIRFDRHETAIRSDYYRLSHHANSWSTLDPRARLYAVVGRSKMINILPEIIDYKVTVCWPA